MLASCCKIWLFRGNSHKITRRKVKKLDAEINALLPGPGEQSFDSIMDSEPEEGSEGEDEEVDSLLG